MPPTIRPCTVCEHPDRVAVEAAIRAATPPLRTVADRHKLSKTALLRHRDNHMTGLMRTADDVVRERSAKAAVVQVERASTALARGRAEQAVDDAVTTQALARELLEVTLGPAGPDGRRAPEDTELALKALKELVHANGGGVQRALELLAKMTGEIKTGSTTNVLIQDGRVVHPELARVMDCVLSALAPYPEAGAAVLKALEEMAGEAGGATR